MGTVVGLVLLLGAALAATGGSSRPAGARRGGGGAPRGSAEMGEISTTRQIQAQRLGISVTLWDELVRWSNDPRTRRRPGYSRITGPVARIENWLRVASNLSIAALDAERDRMLRDGFPLMAEHLAQLADAHERAEAGDG